MPQNSDMGVGPSLGPASWAGTIVRSKTAPLDILHLAELVPVVRQRFAIDEAFADDAILSSLKTIATHGAARERWRAAFSSNLGVLLSRQGRDLNTALNTLIDLLPRPTS